MQENKNQQTKQQQSNSMKLQNYEQKQSQMSSANTANQLKTLSNANIQRKINDKQVDFLVKQLGMDKIKASNLLKKYQLKQAIKLVINN